MLRRSSGRPGPLAAAYQRAKHVPTSGWQRPPGTPKPLAPPARRWPETPSP
ncbi:hypothetical protein GBAR_LOCUS22250 [Geodia barretti]|uniref:Uncharacterized protein n=1 Tax=Geodia barretti TaxID=519541 RepID=A0AA35T2A4_GEOBA|nr:hypothetical protein GBAR_LOCUS22250 [Geodia barretti]